MDRNYNINEDDNNERDNRGLIRIVRTNYEIFEKLVPIINSDGEIEILEVPKLIPTDYEIIELPLLNLE